VSIFDRSKVLVMIAVGVAALAVVRCAPPDGCLRISDCASGLTCVEGSCVPDRGDPGEGGIAEGGGSDGTVAEASTPADASVVTHADAASDAGDAGDGGDGGDSGDGATSASSDASPE
jgi:hypothetical protein